MILLAGIIAGCASNAADTTQNATLPPIPVREKLEEPPNSIKNTDPEALAWIASTLSYYENLVIQWEIWEENVKAIIANSKK